MYDSVTMGQTTVPRSLFHFFYFSVFIIPGPTVQTNFISENSSYTTRLNQTPCVGNDMKYNIYILYDEVRPLLIFILKSYTKPKTFPRI